MTAILSNILDRSLARSHRKKVDNYLRNFTTESVLQDLSNTIVIRDRATAISPQAIFDASCIRDTPQEKPWQALKTTLRKPIRELPFQTELSVSMVVLLLLCLPPLPTSGR
ncbi:hypothetical protein M747DRAFT_337950 [Aspergillus niger ATCC 13496]|uniref:Uncharacterized protein n=1 Tax=Aspergillus niger ATCC 13496 TaxID=1353008 RepID=A0A370CDY8_ASPNG|nr:hypothetical protein M747DRAFT_337950 [Aspergillus niger ATCC 13496]